MNSFQDKSEFSFVGFILEAEISAASNDSHFINAIILNSTDSIIMKNVRFDENVCRSMFHLEGTLTQQPPIPKS